jgi:hypothetical protein
MKIEEQASGPTADPHPGSVARQDPNALIDRLVRINNLAIFAVFCTGLLAVALVQTVWHGQKRPQPPPLGILTWLRLALPMLGLLMTALVTHRAMSRLAVWSRKAGQLLTLETAAPAFYRSKLAATLMHAAAGVFAAACLVVGHRVSDVLLALLPIVMLLITRTNLGGLTAFTSLARETAAEANPPSE